MLLVVATIGCGDDGVLSDQSKPKKSTVPAKESPPAETQDPAPNEIKDAALVRRLALDTIALPPPQAMIEQVKSDPAAYATILENLLSDQRTATAFATQSASRLGLDSRRLADFDTLSQGGETAVTSLLAGTGRQDLLREVGDFYQWLITKTHSPLAMFISPVVITSAGGVTAWSLTDQGQAFPSHANRVGIASDSRPHLGILGLPQVMAGLSRSGDKYRTHRAYHMLTALLCSNYDGVSAHDFSGLTTDELASSMFTLSETKAPCGGCHRDIHDIARVTNGLFSGSSLNTWRGYTDTPLTYTGYLGGQSFQTLSELGQLLARDPRTPACEATALAEQYLQIPRNLLPAEITAKTTERLAEFKLRPLTGIRNLLLLKQYRYVPLAATLKGEILWNSSGIRVLRKHHWEALARYLAPHTTITSSPSLEPGRDSGAREQNGMPEGLYWHAVQSFARSLAEAIVSEELQDSYPRLNRIVLRAIPDGAPTSTVTSAIVEAQVIALWQMLTGVTVTSADPHVQDLVTLWGSLSGTSSANDARAAWQVMLTGLLTHPNFVLY